ncbi:fimbria/pilus periplasmic chaperone [Serratia plymuthica]|uniref:fimbria/pilus periplasmic chaperone n=1 Tax=Serratia plymuthica TaxID=82996 RepID=UPI001926F2FD|nr:fimbria/pilus periplasmic chaperone [Serratia plymuthica]MBL3523568.1 fimbria/pilus periplasmic chaperone [Serratia plymuthica]
MRNNTVKTLSVVGLLTTMLLSSQAQSAIALDRTRVILNGEDSAVSMTISNKNTQLPYLAQGWLENEGGDKITSPLIVLPPVQRLEPGAQSQIKVQALPGVKALPQDRESLFYFNLREIPPKSSKANTLQIALQTRIKLFYRPASIVPSKNSAFTPWQEQLTLTRQGDNYKVNNPTPYYITLVDARSSKDGKTAAGFEPLMVSPKGSVILGASGLGNAPVLTYVNDYGGRPDLTFKCGTGDCQVVVEAKG